MMKSRRDACLPVLMKGGARIAAVFLCVLSGVQAAVAAPPVARQSYSLSDFDTIRLEAPVEVAVTTGKGVTGSGVGDRDTLDALSLEVNSRILVIHMRSLGTLGGSGARPRAPTRLSLSTYEMKRVSVMGSGTLAVDRLKGARVNATLSGGGRLTVARVEADRIDVGQAGSGTMVLAGSALDAAVVASGSGRLDGQALDTRRLRVTVEGSADVALGARDEANASANGTGQLVIAGKARCTVRKVGSGSLLCAGAAY